MNVVFLVFCIIGIGTVGFIESFSKIIFWATSFWGAFNYLWSKSGKLNIISEYKIVVPVLLAWMLIRTINVEGVSLFLKFALLMFFFLLNLNFKRIDKRGLIFASSIIILFSLCIYRDVFEFFSNPNIGGVIAVVVFYLTFVYVKRCHFIYVCVGLLCTVIFGSRSVMVALFIAIIIVYLLSKQSGVINLILAISVCVGVAVIATSWTYLLSPDLNKLVYMNTGKNLQSGRLDIWVAVLSQMNGLDWIIGKGGGFDYHRYLPDYFAQLSLHSSYIYIIVNYGIVGLCLLCMLFYKCMKRLMKDKSYFSATLFLFFVLRDFFEVTLVNNQMALAFFFWAFLANGNIEKNLQYCYSKQNNV